MQLEAMFECKSRGQKRQLKVTQLSIYLFDKTGTKLLNTWLFEKLDGWEFQGESNTFLLRHGKAVGTKPKEEVFKM